MEEVEEFLPAMESASIEKSDTSVIHRGGEYAGEQLEVFPVEDEVEEISIDWMSNQKDSILTLHAPGNKTYSSFIRTKDETGFFPNAYHHSIVILKPRIGKWKLKTEHKTGEKYLMNVIFKKGNSQEIGALGFENPEDNLTNQAVKKNTTILYQPLSGEKEKAASLETSKDLSSLSLSKYDEGIHNITIDVSGTTKKGYPFERTIIKTIYVDGSGKIY